MQKLASIAIVQDIHELQRELQARDVERSEPIPVADMPGEAPEKLKGIHVPAKSVPGRIHTLAAGQQKPANFVQISKLDKSYLELFDETAAVRGLALSFMRKSDEKIAIKAYNVFQQMPENLRSEAMKALWGNFWPDTVRAYLLRIMPDQRAASEQQKALYLKKLARRSKTKNHAKKQQAKRRKQARR
jgi:hypothetical protein